ncbi:universal stress protein [Actinomycetospora lemnae]|uniref:Universal stress protein n=1 Tax=Actinomycetospora lemnae TaxID=3019891 RepID=A0ABT5SZX8_9PSEU|nr:universal stress protein [Actinomycetospora sp. DW7H6]MDD7968425.1 universal stress protein [Actinomycetospora sp. DW7H6]
MDEKAAPPRGGEDPRDRIELVRARGVALVVAGFDGSDEAAEAVRWAASLARLTGGALRVVWAWKLRDVWDAAVADQETGSPHLAEMEAVARRRLTEVVAELVGDEVPDVDLVLSQGPDAAGILLHAARGADVLVVGSRGRGRASTALLGSVSARCVREAVCPVLVIPHRLAPPPAAPPGTDP